MLAAENNVYYSIDGGSAGHSPTSSTRLGDFLEADRAPRGANLRSDNSRASTQGYYYNHPHEFEKNDGNVNDNDDDGFNLDDLIEPDEEEEQQEQRTRKKQLQSISMSTASTVPCNDDSFQSFHASVRSTGSGGSRGDKNKYQSMSSLGHRPPRRQAQRSSSSIPSDFESMMHHSMPCLRMNETTTTMNNLDASGSSLMSNQSGNSIEYSDDAPRARRKSFMEDMNRSLPHLGDDGFDFMAASHRSYFENHNNNNNRMHQSTPCFDQDALDSLLEDDDNDDHHSTGGGRSLSRSARYSQYGRGARRAPAGMKEILQRASSSLPPKTPTTQQPPPPLHSSSSLGSHSERGMTSRSNGDMGSTSFSRRPPPPPRTQSDRPRGGRGIYRSHSEQGYGNTTAIGRAGSGGLGRLQNSLRNTASGGSSTIGSASSVGSNSQQPKTTRGLPPRSKSNSSTCSTNSSSGPKGRSVPLARIAPQRSKSSESTTRSSRQTKKVGDMKYLRNIRMKDPNGQDGRYTGLASNFTGAPCGEGRLEFANGGYYDGEWLHGVRTGRGKLLNKLKNGDIYEGDFMDNYKHGQGIMTFSDGRTVQGKFVLDDLSEGTMIYPNGASYTGKFRNGKRHGIRGTYEYQDGVTTYVGNFEDDAITGHGAMKWPDGSKHVGEWKNGIQDGFGKEYGPDGSLRHEGLWHEGKIVA